MLVGLLKPTGGRISLDGEPVDYRRPADVRRMRDRVAIVFQQYNLFQNMTVLGNVTIAPVKINKRPRAEVETEARRLLESVGLGDKLDAYPDSSRAGSSSASRSRGRWR